MSNWSTKHIIIWDMYEDNLIHKMNKEMSTRVGTLAFEKPHSLI